MAWLPGELTLVDVTAGLLSSLPLAPVTSTATLLIDLDDPFGQFLEAAVVHGGPLSGSASSAGPISTVDFPRPTDRKRTRRVRRPTARGEGCCICLESLAAPGRPPGAEGGGGLRRPRGSVVTLPCTHSLHDRCLWAVQTNGSLGATSMMRCPLCRFALDRYSLYAMGYDVRPSQLVGIAGACGAFRALLTNDLWRQHRGPDARRLALVRAIRQCRSLSALDGFVYNTCVVALERMLQHKRLMVHTLRLQMGRRPPDPMEVIRSTLAYHVDVLIHTAHVAMD